MRRHLIVGIALLVGGGSLVSASARAEADWFASLYTGEGTELRADERVFALYALLNSMGYDQAPVVRQHPVIRHQFHPVRQQVRDRLTLDPELRKQAEAFFDAHPQPVERYLGYAVTGGAPPFTQGSKAKEYGELKGLEALLAKAYSSWKLGEVLSGVQAEYRKALKGYLTAIDGPMAKAQKLLKVGENAPPSLLVLNLLDGHNEAHGVMGTGEVVVVVGPSDKPNVEAVVREYAQVMLQDSIGKKAQSGWSGGAGLLKEAQLYGAPEKTVGDYAAALLARALALKATDAGEGAYEAAAQKGYFGLKEIARNFDEGKPVESWALDALGKVRPAGKR
jgi:hypothetical protein